MADRRSSDALVDAPPPRHRRLSLLLIGLGGIFLTVNAVTLFVAQPGRDPSIWVSLLVWLLCAFVGDRVLARIVPDRDPYMFPLVMFLTGWGLIIIARVAPAFAGRQTVWMVLAVAVLTATTAPTRIVHWLRTYRYTLLTGGLALLVATIVFGSNPSGVEGAPTLWLGIGDFYFQPSEPLKIVLVAFLASYLAEQYSIIRAENIPFGKTPSPRIFGPVLLMWGLSLIMLVWQRDLGTAALFFVVFLALLYVSSGQLSLLVGGAVLAVLAGGAAYLLFGVVRLRVDTWLNPWPEADGRAFQIVQSLMAFASGSILGKGIGQGSPTYIPVVHSDFIFAALGEEWGLIGIVTTLICFAVIIARGLRASATQRPFPALLSVGLSVLLAVQSLLIMGGVLKIIPLTGVTLPFMSYGGSSLVTNFIVVGLLLRLSAGEHPRALSA